MEQENEPTASNNKKGAVSNYYSGFDRPRNLYNTVKPQLNGWYWNKKLMRILMQNYNISSLKEPNRFELVNREKHNINWPRSVDQELFILKSAS